MSTYAEKIRNGLIEDEHKLILASELDPNYVLQELENLLNTNNLHYGTINWNEEHNVIKVVLNNISVSKYHPTYIKFTNNCTCRYNYLKHSCNFLDQLHKLGFKLVYSQRKLIKNDYKLSMLLIIVDQKNNTGFFNKIKNLFQTHYHIPDQWMLGDLCISST